MARREPQTTLERTVWKILPNSPILLLQIRKTCSFVTLTRSHLVLIILEPVAVFRFPKRPPRQVQPHFIVSSLKTCEPASRFHPGSSGPCLLVLHPASSDLKRHVLSTRLVSSSAPSAEPTPGHLPFSRLELQDQKAECGPGTQEPQAGSRQGF